MCNASVRSHHGPLTGPARDSPMFIISYGTRTGPVRDPQGCRMVLLRIRKGIDTTRICQNPARASYVAVLAPCGPAQAVHVCLLYLNLYGARKLIMRVLKLYDSRTGRQNSYGAARVSYWPREWAFYFCSKQPRISPYRVRCHVAWALLKTSKTFRCNHRGRRWNVQDMSVIE